MECPKCGEKNNDTAKFCKKCGNQLLADKVIVNSEEKKDNKKLIIAAVAIVVIVLAGVGVYASGILNSGLPLENKDFEYFRMDVPVESDFELSDGAAKDNDHIALVYDNTGKYSSEVNKISFGKGLEDAVDGLSPDEVDGDLKVYKGSNGDFDYGVLYEKDDFMVILIGDDLNTMKNMAKSLEIGDVKNFTYTSSPQTTTTQTTQTATPQTTAMSILGGSFSTGGGLEDKTYAKIDVGKEHAGESVIIQIFYSRDGADLNNGNMVPKTVTSDGYIEVASAEPYDKFPDHADINLYDSSNNLLDAYSVDLSPSSGTQTF